MKARPFRWFLTEELMLDAGGGLAAWARKNKRQRTLRAHNGQSPKPNRRKRAKRLL